MTRVTGTMGELTGRACGLVSAHEAAGNAGMRRALLLTSALVPVVALTLGTPYGATQAHAQAVSASPVGGVGGNGGSATGGKGADSDLSGPGKSGADGGSGGAGAGGGGAGVTGGAGGIGGSGGGTGGLGGAAAGAAGGKGDDGGYISGPAGNGNGGGGGGGGAHGYVNTAGTVATSDITGGAGGDGGKGGRGLSSASAAGAGGGAGGGGAGAVVSDIIGNKTWSHGVTGGAGGKGGLGGGVGLAGNGGNGGAGGAGLVYNADSVSGLTLDGVLQGGTGGNAGNGGLGNGYNGKGGTGGAGGAGLSYSGGGVPSSVVVNGVVKGGTGGSNDGGQASIDGNGGAGGAGGAGIFYSGIAGGIITVNAAVTGGVGGTGAGGTSGPKSGVGGLGISIDPGASVNVNSAVKGGNGGAGYVLSYFNRYHADGGAGIAGSNMKLNVGIGGTISGGLNGDGGVRAPSVIFTGGSGNTLSFDSSITNSTGIFTGEVQIDRGASVTFERATDFNFSSSFTGSGELIKKGDGALTLSSSSSLGAMTIEGGTLATTNAAYLNIGGVLTLADPDVKVLLGGSANVGWLAGAGGEVNISADKTLTATGYSDSNTFGGVISGAGSFSKTGFSTQTLTGDNTYAGGTSVTGGKLEIGNGGTSGSIDGDVKIGTGARFAFNRSDATAYAGELSGDGTFLKDGTGTVTLTGNSALNKGGAIVAKGTLQIGDGGTSGALSANVSVEKTAALAFNRSDNVSFSGTVSGTGSLVKNGAGTLTLLANNIYTGNTTVSEGTLQVGNGFGSGSIAGDAMVAKDARLSFNRSNTLTYTGAVSGGGAFTKAGTGTLILIGDSTHTGGTTVSGGTLQIGNNGTSGSIAGDVALGKTARFIIHRRDATSFEGVLSGEGAFVKAGTGTLTLTGKNTYTGGTTVSGGTLSGSVSSIRGNLLNGGTAIFDEAADATFEGNIAGNGTAKGNMIKQGAGQLTLTGRSDLDWSLQAGGLTTASDRFTGDLNLVAGTNFTFDQQYNGTYGGLISGDGAVRFAGGGLVLLSGNSSAYTGTSNIDTAISVNGALGGNVNVRSGGMLKGNGTVGTTTLASGAIIAPGNSIGTLNIAGDLTYGTGSLYEVEIDSKGGSDRINVSGTATLNNAGLKVVSLDPEVSYQNGQTYTILTAGTLSGEFAAPTMVSAFLTPTLSYSGNAAILALKTVTKPTTPTDPTTPVDPTKPLFVSAAQTHNQWAAASGLDGLDQTAGSDSLVLYNRVLFLDASNARVAFDQLSGEIHASVKSGLLADTHQSREAISDRISAAFDNDADAGEGISAWTTAYGSFASNAGSGNVAALDRNSGGLLIGADGLMTDATRIGLVAGYGQSSLKLNDRASSANTDSTLLGIYGGTELGGLTLKAGAAYSWNSTKTSRSVGFSGFHDTLDARYDSGTAQVFGEAAYRIAVAPGAYFEPFANLAYVNLDTDNVSEQGGAAALHGLGDTTDATFSTLGLRVAGPVSLGSMAVTVKGMVGWRHAYGEVSPNAALGFSSGPGFGVTGAPLARDTALVEGGLDFALTPNATLGVSYAGEFGGGVTDNSVRTKLQVKF